MGWAEATQSLQTEQACHPCSECGPACGCWCQEDCLDSPSANSEIEEDESILCSMGTSAPLQTGRVGPADTAAGEERRGQRRDVLCGACCSMKSLPVTPKGSEALPVAVELDGPPTTVPLHVSLQQVRRMSGTGGLQRRAAQCSFEVDLGSEPIAAIQIRVTCGLFFRLSLFQGGT